MAKKALTAVIQEACIEGVSTRSVDALALAQAMGMSGIAKGQVSRLCAEIDDRIAAFLERPIEGEWRCPWLDATYPKVREGGRVVSTVVIIAVAVNSDGRRKVLGMGIGPVGGRDLLDRVLAQAGPPRAEGRQAHRFGCTS
jgi:putative transposase